MPKLLVFLLASHGYMIFFADICYYEVDNANKQTYFLASNSKELDLANRLFRCSVVNPEQRLLLEWCGAAHRKSGDVVGLVLYIQVRVKKFVPNKKGDIGMEVYYLCQPTPMSLLSLLLTKFTSNDIGVGLT